MINSTFGEVTFDYGWNTNGVVSLWGKEYTILVTASAYFENEHITIEQEQAYTSFRSTLNAKESSIERILFEYLSETLGYEPTGEQLIDIVTPKSLIFERNGGYALLLSYANEPENGIVVRLAPEVTVLTQDEYL